jgi:hypothetical protein
LQNWFRLQTGLATFLILLFPLLLVVTFVLLLRAKDERAQVSTSFLSSLTKACFILIVVAVLVCRA